MKRSRCSEELIAFALRHAESGTPVNEAFQEDGCHRAGLCQISEHQVRWAPNTGHLMTAFSFAMSAFRTKSIAKFA